MSAYTWTTKMTDHLGEKIIAIETRSIEPYTELKTVKIFQNLVLLFKIGT